MKREIPAKGVTRLPSGRYRARIFPGRKSVSLGTFATIEEAQAAYLAYAVTVYDHEFVHQGGENG